MSNVLNISLFVIMNHQMISFLFSLSLRNKEASEFSDAFFCCGCEPGSHVLSVASLCESAPSGRARIPLWERKGSAQPIPLSHPKN